MPKITILFDILLCIVIVITLFFFASSFFNQQESHAGVAIVFDDNYVDHWFDTRPLLQKYNANVTFFVTKFSELNKSQVQKLKILQRDGNEIAYHGNYHVNVNKYLVSHTVDEYFNNEIISGLTMMKAQGIDPVDFAYPYSRQNATVTQELTKYFHHISMASEGVPVNNFYYYIPGSNESLIYATDIDTRFNYTQNDFLHVILKAKNDNKIVILVAHDTSDTEPSNISIEDSYNIHVEDLEGLLKNVSQNQLKFYKISELN